MEQKFLPSHTRKALELLNDHSKLLNKYRFYLGGGTALAFSLKYRISYDLDFFTLKDFEPSRLRKDFESFLDIEEVSSSSGTLKFKALNTEFSFFCYQYELLGDFTYEQNIKLGNILDLALMKITAIADRSMKKDFSDLYYCAKVLGGLENILDRFSEKYPNSNKYHYLKCLSFFDEVDEGTSLDVIVQDYDWNKIKRYFTEEVNNYISSQIT